MGQIETFLIIKMPNDNSAFLCIKIIFIKLFIYTQIYTFKIYV